MEGERIGILAVIYDYKYTGVMEDLTDIQHNYSKYINAAMHIHMTEKYQLDVIVLKGDIKHIRDLTENIKRLKGVKHVKLTSVGSGENQT